MKMQSSLLPQLQQKMKLSPQIIQSIEILQLPILALVEQVQQELVDNPVLEEVVDEKKDETLREADDTPQTAGDDDVKRMSLTNWAKLLKIGVSTIHRLLFGEIICRMNVIKNKKHWRIPPLSQCPFTII